MQESFSGRCEESAIIAICNSKWTYLPAQPIKRISETHRSWYRLCRPACVYVASCRDRSMRVTTRKQHLINENDECIRTKRSYILRIQQSLSGSVCCHANVLPGSSTSIDACCQCSASKSPSPMLVSTRTNCFVLHSISFRKYCCRECYFASTV